MEDVGEKLVEVQQIANDNIKAEANVVEEEKETTTEKIQQQSEEAEQTQQTENE